ncbi:MAG TPA: hypothetical protein VGH19_07650 [Verrucomicrobiae bacterium]
MKMSIPRLVAGSLLLFLSLQGVQAAEDYAIRLSPPVKVGSKYGLEAKLNEVSKNVITVDGQQMRNETSEESWRFEGKVEVQEVDAKGTPTNLSVQVQKLTVTQAGNSSELLPSGSRLTVAVKEGKKVFEMGGKEAEPAVVKALREVITLNSENDPPDDVLFGTAERKKAGDSWPMNLEVLIQTLGKNGMELKPEDAKGSVSKLEEVVTMEGKKCLKISSNIEMQNFRPPMPTWMKVKQAKASVKSSGLFPVDGSGRLTATLDHLMSVKAEGADPGGKTMALHLERTLKGEKKFRYE